MVKRDDKCSICCRKLVESKVVIRTQSAHIRECVDIIGFRRARNLGNGESVEPAVQERNQQVVVGGYHRVFVEGSIRIEEWFLVTGQSIVDLIVAFLHHNRNGRITRTGDIVVVDIESMDFLDTAVIRCLLIDIIIHMIFIRVIINRVALEKQGVVLAPRIAGGVLCQHLVAAYRGDFVGFAE